MEPKSGKVNAADKHSTEFRFNIILTFLKVVAIFFPRKSDFKIQIKKTGGPVCLDERIRRGTEAAEAAAAQPSAQAHAVAHNLGGSKKLHACSGRRGLSIVNI